jgi:hypothetical protein
MKKRTASEEYLLKAQKLTKKQAEQLCSRMGGKLERRLEKQELNSLEALAIQLEKEDEDLMEWRERFAEIKALKKKNEN